MTTTLLRKAILAAVLVVAGIAAFADNDRDEPHPPVMHDPETYPMHQSIYRGYNRTVDEYGDSITRFYLKPFVVFQPLKFTSPKEEKFYWLTVARVRKTLPYAKMIRETLIETYEYIETFPTQKEREDYLKAMEHDLFEQYKPVLKKLSRQQANILVKLIQRETDQTSYEIVKAFLGNARAIFWQGFGKLFGVNLRNKFQPDKNRDDAIIDRVATQIEQGLL